MLRRPLSLLAKPQSPAFRGGGEVDEARAHHARSFAGRVQKLPFAGRMGIIFTAAFVFGVVVETFACKTHLYEAVAHKKAARRHELDEFVAEFRENLEGWQAEDMHRAELLKQAQARAQAEAQKAAQ